MLVDDVRLECVIEMSGPDPAVFEVLTVQMAGKIAVAAHELLPAFNGFFERQIFNAVQWIVVDESPHRPVLGDDFASKTDDPAQFHSPGFNVRQVC